MTATSSVNSSALGFVSNMTNGVDPRTGLYGMSVNLPQILGNNMRGPGFELKLSYSALNIVDSGFGLGWNLLLSQYTPSTQMLSLSTGETFRVTGFDSKTGQFLMKEKKLDTFHFYPHGDGQFRLVHKSGLVEILKVQGSTENRVALPIEIHSREGHKITLQYRPFGGSYWMLEWIKDDSDQTLLTVDRTDTSIELQMHPYAGSDDGPLARFVMTLGGSVNYVTSISLPTQEDAFWSFNYSLQGQDDLYCIDRVETPTGGREELFYQDGGHLFPEDSGRNPLPRVTRLLTYPGFDQETAKVVEVRYTYPADKNFLGFGLPIRWADDGLDNLFKYIGDYEYQCVETLWVEKKAVRSIERKFNQFHLLTSEKTTQNNNTVQTIETLYEMRKGIPFEQQSTTCQLPTEVKTTWSIEGNVTRYRSETTKSTYDEHGNLLTKTDANGVVETNTWLPADDTDDFVRYITDRTITPAPSPDGKAPTLRTRYTYKTMPPVDGSPLPHWHTVESLTLEQLEPKGGIELQRTVYAHVDQSDDAFLHGQIERQTITMSGQSCIVDYQYRMFDSPELGIPVQEVTEVLSSDFDAARKEITRQYSLLTAQEVLSLIDNVETRYTYDALNRLNAEVVGQGTPFEASRKYEYTFSLGRDQQAEHVVENAKGIRTRTVLDGLGRAIFQERDHVDSDDPSRTRQSGGARFNAWGTLEEKTEYDWVDGKELKLVSRFQYDDWGQQCVVIGPDGVESHQTTDPIGTPEHQGPILRSWQQSSDSSPAKTAVSETRLNGFGKPVEIRVLDAADNEISRQVILYDGLGRCTQQTDPMGRVTRFTYDPWSRMVSSTLPDDSIVSHSFAAFTSSPLPVALKVSGDGENYTQVGEQDFDGLERLKRVTTGQRTERFEYNAGQMQVSRKTTPDNKTIEYDYNLNLSNQPTALRAPDEIASYTYDQTSARLTEAKNEQGTREYKYNTANQLLSESWVDKHANPWETLYSTSMQGRQVKRTDLKQADTDGLDTVYHHDDCGRVESIDQGLLQALFEYDKLGRLSKITTKDLAVVSVLVTELHYDLLGRETLRILTLDQQPPRTQKQTWRADGLLESRHLQQGKLNLLAETFDYDFRGRLTEHTCSGSTLPRDSEGREISKQLFVFDALDNIILTLTTFADGTNERANYKYATDDPCQLQSITYSPKRTTGDPTFSYDRNGNQLNDERGQRLKYDSQNRLLRVENTAGQVISQYRYDSHDHLVYSQQGTQSDTLRFYQGEQLVNTVQDDNQTQLLYHMGQPLGQQLAGDASQSLLLLTDANHSVIGESQQHDLRTAVYSAYGERHGDDLQSLLAFNGEVLDTCKWYLLGRGYRAYNPCLKRFHTPDSQSPFGGGGVNPYTYCLGNPIALRDPSGHQAEGGWSGRLRRPDEDETPALGAGSDAGSWVGVIIGAVFAVVGVATTIATFGFSGPITIPLAIKGTLLAAASTLTVASTAAGAVSLANGDEVAGKWSMYLGYAAIVPSVGAYAFAAVAARTISHQLNELMRALRHLPRAATANANAAGLATAQGSAAMAQGSAAAASAPARRLGWTRIILNRFARKPKSPGAFSPGTGPDSNEGGPGQTTSPTPATSAGPSAATSASPTLMDQMNAASTQRTAKGSPGTIRDAANHANTRFNVDIDATINGNPVRQ